MIGHGFGPGGRGSLFEDKELICLNMRKRMGRRRRKNGDKKLISLVKAA